MTDAGSAFYSWNGMNRFQKLISEEYGIDQTKAGSPRSNGKVESVNKQIEKELLTVKEFSSLDDAGHGIAEWIEFPLLREIFYLQNPSLSVSGVALVPWGHQIC